MNGARSPWPRALDVGCAGIALLLAAPVMVVIGLALWLERPGAVLHRQERIGRGGAPFALHKFRTLTVAEGPAVAPANDPRATRFGRWLRRWRLDELPQLVDVLRGSMALVGPRPEVPANLQHVQPEARLGVGAVHPGLTGPTQLAFLAEDEVLARLPDPVEVYRRILVPAKVQRDLAWLASRTFLGDLRVLAATPWTVCSRRARERSRRMVEELLGRPA